MVRTCTSPLALMQRSSWTEPVISISPLEVPVRTAPMAPSRRTCQGNTASSSFFFLRGLAAADVELTLPRRYWDFLQGPTRGKSVSRSPLTVLNWRTKPSPPGI